MWAHDREGSNEGVMRGPLARAKEKYSLSFHVR